MNGFDLKDITNIVPTTTDCLISIEILPRGCTKYICLRFEQNFLITNSFNHHFQYIQDRKNDPEIHKIELHKSQHNSSLTS